MRGFIYDRIECMFLEVDVTPLDGYPHQGDYVLFEDGMLSFCCDTEYDDNELYLLVEDIGCLSNSENDDLGFDEDCFEQSEFRVSALETEIRPCSIRSLKGSAK